MKPLFDTAEVFDRYCALTTLAPEPGGLLVFYGELDTCGMATASAANIAGAASLGMDANPDQAKLALRNGICDFMVNNLDEALRILKNEIRRKRPVAVALVSKPDAVVAEMIARGVQPDVVMDKGQHSAEFVRRGAKVLYSNVPHDWLPVSWSIEQEPATWLPRVDAIAIEAFSNASDIRVKWLQVAPRYLRNNLSHQRYVRMTAAESERFTALLGQQIQAGKLPPTISLAKATP
jgi:urocanate hydratase